MTSSLHRGNSENVDGKALPEFDICIVGAGLAGLYALYRLRSLGFSCRVLEAGDGVGGTWYWNRYPGARCDIESYQYSYSFDDDLQREWKWTERFAGQEEILSYLEHVAERFSLYEDISFGHTITAMRFDEASNRWTVETSNGPICSARFCIMATGVLSKPRDIHLPGMEAFEGPIYSTAYWPSDRIDLQEKRVALIGTGASGCQLLPHLVDQVGHVTVFQRTPNFCVPTANAPVDPAYEARWQADYKAIRSEQATTPGAVIFDINPRTATEASESELRAEFERRWKEDGGLNFMRSFSDLSRNETSNALAADFVRDKIRTIVEDEETAHKLTPYGYPIDARRLATTDREFYSLFNRPDVALISVLEEEIVSVQGHGIKTTRQDYPFDAIILATGFEPITGAMMAIDIVGIDGIPVHEKWRDRPAAYLGIGVAGLPNMFLVNGPGAPGALANMFSSSELLVDWVAECICFLRENGISRIETKKASQAEWMNRVQKLGEKTLMWKAETSGYVYINAARERVFLCYSGGFPEFRTVLSDVKANNYAGFSLVP